MDPQLMKFLETKREYEQKGWTTNYIFETTYYEHLKEIYGKKMLALEKKLEPQYHNEPEKLGTFLMCGRHAQKSFTETTTGIKIIHLASGNGFSRGDMGLIEEESSDALNRNKAERFERAFKQIVSNKEFCPDKSLLILSVDQQKLLEKGGKLPRISVTNSAKKRGASRLKNQRRIDEFFKSDKPRPATEKPYKKPEPAPKYTIETILASLRGDKVRILWLPKLYFQLDPSKYVAVFLLNKISLQMDQQEEVEGEEVKTLRDLCAESVNVFPNEVWAKIDELVDSIIAGYLQDENRDDNQQDENGPGGSEQDEGRDSEQDESAANESNDNTANEQDITANCQQEEITIKSEPVDEYYSQQRFSN